MVNLYEEKKLKYNGKEIIASYTQIVTDNKNPEIGFIRETNAYKYFLAYYHSQKLTVNIISVTSNKKTATESTSSRLSLPPAITEPAPVSVKMDATKLTVVKKVYPLLAMVENYDVTNGGKDPKPFSETYEFRQSSGAPNPPSAIDCFTADLQIIYNQRKNYDLPDLPVDVTKNNMPSATAEKLLHVYMVKEARSIPGYKPWTHWKFIRSLTAEQRSQLAIELEGYIKQYGFTE